MLTVRDGAADVVSVPLEDGLFYKHSESQKLASN